MPTVSDGCHRSPDGDDVGCDGVRLRAQIRSVAAIITVEGHLDATNFEPVLQRVCRFVRLGDPLVLDVRGLQGGELLAELVSVFGLECDWGGVQWVLVTTGSVVPRADEHVVHAHSTGRALAHLITVIQDRRHRRSIG